MLFGEEFVPAEDDGASFKEGNVPQKEYDAMREQTAAVKAAMAKDVAVGQARDGVFPPQGVLSKAVMFEDAGESNAGGAGGAGESDEEEEGCGAGGAGGGAGGAGGGTGGAGGGAGGAGGGVGGGDTKSASESGGGAGGIDVDALAERVRKLISADVKAIVVER